MLDGEQLTTPVLSKLVKGTGRVVKRGNLVERHEWWPISLPSSGGSNVFEAAMEQK